MSPQVKEFKRQIDLAREGDKFSIRVLRLMLRSCAKTMPVDDLITVCETLAEVGERLSWEDEHRN